LGRFGARYEHECQGSQVSRAHWRWPDFATFVASFRRRIIFRGVFLLLALVVVAMTWNVLQDEKERSYQSYQASFRKTQEQIASRLNHPAGHLALLNPPGLNTKVTPLHPVVLPYAAIDFDDANKVQQAVENTGCLVQYKPYGAVCVAVGNNPYTGGFIYVAGRFQSGDLVSRVAGERDTRLAHRARVTLDIRGQQYKWIAPFERIEAPARTLPAVIDAPVRAAGKRGRLTGFVDTGNVLGLVKPVKDFRGWVWQSPECADVAEEAKNGRESCTKRSFFSLRLPVDVLSDEIYRQPRPVWPPRDLDQILVRVEVLQPGSDAPFFDSNDSSATRPFALEDLQSLLLPGESLRIRKAGSASNAPDLVKLVGIADEPQVSARWMDRIVRRIPVEGFDTPIEARDAISTSLGTYDLLFTGDVRSVNKTLSTVATRVSWFVGAMLVAIVVAWLLIEIGLIRRIAVLTQRARNVSQDVQQGAVGKSDRALAAFSVADLRGKDELGILASGLHDLMLRVNEDVKREHIRAEQERDTWHAVGHEIMSPLQSLMVLHGDAADPSHRYIQRMQQAVRVLYGQASPSEAIASTTLHIESVNLSEFLSHVASNAPSAGIENVQFIGGATNATADVKVKADEYSLEDVVTHVLRNADRYRVKGSAITMTLAVDASTATVTIHNQGQAIADDLIDRIFEYGVSDPKYVSEREEAGEGQHRGQGLFVAKTYMAKMGGTISARNTHDGVSFVLTLARVG
jgi:signal transduction histidine kinase